MNKKQKDSLRGGVLRQEGLSLSKRLLLLGDLFALLSSINGKVYLVLSISNAFHLKILFELYDSYINVVVDDVDCRNFFKIKGDGERIIVNISNESI